MNTAPLADTGYFDAWRLWAHGHLPDDTIMWGLPVYWWGRIGKTLEVIGALAVIAELLGQSRLQAIADSLDATRIKETAGSMVTAIGTWLGAALRHPLAWLVIGSIGVLAIYSATRPRTAPLGDFTETMVDAVMAALAVVVVVVLAFMALLALLAIVDRLLIEPMSRLLRNRRLATNAQIAGLCLLVVGFHFDLLGG